MSELIIYTWYDHTQFFLIFMTKLQRRRLKKKKCNKITKRKFYFIHSFLVYQSLNVHICWSIDRNNSWVTQGYSQILKAVCDFKYNSWFVSKHLIWLHSLHKRFYVVSLHFPPIVSVRNFVFCSKGNYLNTSQWYHYCLNRREYPVHIFRGLGKNLKFVKIKSLLESPSQRNGNRIRATFVKKFCQCFKNTKLFIILSKINK